MKLFTRVLGFCLAVSLVALGNGLPTAPAESLGLSKERLARITRTMEADVAAARIPGALAMVIRNGKVAYVEARGFADREKSQPMKLDTIFRIYSMSKPITSVAVMMLYEEGKLRLQDPVSKFIPEFADAQVLVENGDGTGKLEKPRRAMTVQDLLRHTSGLTYGFFARSKVDEQYLKAGILRLDKDLAEMTTKLAKIPLKHQPGTRWEYSVSTDVLGRIVEVAGGMRLDEFFQKRIFDPLKMTDTGFFVPDSKRARFAQLYAPETGGKIKPADPAQSARFLDPKATFFSGGGGLMSTAGDYARFCQMLLNGGQLDGVRLLGRKTVDYMASNHLAGTSQAQLPGGRGFGLGFAVIEEPSLTGVASSKGEYSWGGMAGTRFWIDPAEKLIGIYMIQISPHTGLNYGETFKVLTYQALVE